MTLQVVAVQQASLRQAMGLLQLTEHIVPLHVGLGSQEPLPAHRRVHVSAEQLIPPVHVPMDMQLTVQLVPAHVTIPAHALPPEQLTTHVGDCAQLMAP